MPVTSVYRIGGGSSITTDNSASLAAQSAANGALSSTLSSAGVTLTGAGLGVSTGLNVTGSTTLSGLTVQNVLVAPSIGISGGTTNFFSLMNISGTNQAGNVTLAAGGFTVPNSAITANSVVLLSSRNAAVPGLYVVNIPSSGFTISGATSGSVNYFVAKF